MIDLARKAFLNILFLVFMISQVYASSDVRAVYTSTPPRIDGKLDESVWKDAAKISELIQRLPNEGEPQTEDTEFLILFDENFIYIGVIF